MTEPTFSAVIPTLGRPTLWETLNSCVDQLEEGDEIVLVADTREPETAGRVLAVVDDFTPCPLVYLECSHPGSSFGNAQRDAGLAVASGSHLLFLDDDDRYEFGALDLFRRAAGDEWHNAHVFRARWGPGHHAHGAELWREPVVRVGELGTSMVCLPNRRYSRGWMDGNGDGTVSDFAFLAAAIGECAGVSWHPEIVATVRA